MTQRDICIKSIGSELNRRLGKTMINTIRITAIWNTFSEIYFMFLYGVVEYMHDDEDDLVL